MRVYVLRVHHEVVYYGVSVENYRCISKDDLWFLQIDSLNGLSIENKDTMIK